MDTKINRAEHAGKFAVHVTCELHKYKELNSVLIKNENITASATEQLQTSNLLVKLPPGKTECLETNLKYDECTLCKLLFDEIESHTGILGYR